MLRSRLAAVAAVAALLTACSAAPPPPQPPTVPEQAPVAQPVAVEQKSPVQQPPAEQQPAPAPQPVERPESRQSAVWRYSAGTPFALVGNLLVMVRPDAKGLLADEASGRRAWAWETGGAPVERLKGSPDGKYVLVMTPEQYILLDAATGKELGAAPLKGTTTPGGKWTQIYWKGDRIYISQDSWLGSQYQITYFTGFRLVPAGGKVTWEKFTVDDMSGAPNLSVSDDGRTAVQFGQNQLFVEGKRMRTLPAAMSVLPDGSGLYAAEPKGSLAVFDLEGQQQWVRALPAGFTFGGPWQGGFVAANPAAGWVVLKGKDGTGPSGKTELLAITARYLVVRGADGGLDLVDSAGKVAAHLPENAFPAVSDDQQWLWFHSGDEVRAYRLN